jgi:hypothetical protein
MRAGRLFLVWPLAAALAAIAAEAGAGAWPRAPGEAFLSLRADFAESTTGKPVSTSLYGEYGLTPRVTLVGQLSNADTPWAVGRASSSLRFALSPLDAVQRFAVSIGVSAPPEIDGMMTDTQIELGLAWGRGFESPWGGGWATATVKFLFTPEILATGPRITGPDTDAYALIGLRPREGWMAMLSGGRYEDEEGVIWKISPSAGYELRDRLWLVPNVTREFGESERTTLGLSVWFTF